MLHLMVNPQDFHTLITAPVHLPQKVIRSFLCRTCCMQSQKNVVVWGRKRMQERNRRNSPNCISNSLDNFMKYMFREEGLGQATNNGFLALAFGLHEVM